MWVSYCFQDIDLRIYDNVYIPILLVFELNKHVREKEKEKKKRLQFSFLLIAIRSAKWNPTIHTLVIYPDH